MAEQQRFQSGDVVQLKSGGPAMTVGGRVAEDSIRCHWFDGATAKTEIFPVAAQDRGSVLSSEKCWLGGKHGW
jgi:uncharacterized protein YodC (DUF2158 family)